MHDDLSHPIQIRPVRESDLAAYRALRLEALQSHPEAFGSDHAEQAADPESVWANRIQGSIEGQSARILMADAGSELAGMMAVFRDSGAKLRHSVSIVSVFVRPPWRGRRLADQMLHEALAWCRSVQIRIARLTVVTTNAAAIRCYERCGFQPCGIQHEVIRVGDTYHDELLMWRRV